MEEATLHVASGHGWEYVFLNRPRPAETPATFESLKGALLKERERKVEGLRLTGGEPAILPFLVELVASADGFTAITLQTTGQGLDPGLAVALREAGVSRIEVAYLTANASMADMLTQGRDSEAIAAQALEAALSAGIETSARLLLTKFTLLSVGETLERLAALGVKRVFADWIPVRGLLEPKRAWVPPHLLRKHWRPWAERAEDLGIKLDLRAEEGEPACFSPRADFRVELAERHRRIAKAADPPRHTHVRLCGECPQKERCPGIESAERLLLTPNDFLLPRKPVPYPERAVEKQEKKPVSDMSLMTYGSDQARGAVIRINYRCQMTCDFCWVDLHGGEKPWEAIKGEIDKATAEGCVAVSFSGGEPSLSPSFVPAIAYCNELGYRMISVETNAMVLKRPEKADAVVTAGLTDAFVSLHATRSEISDPITGVPDGFPQTVAGIRNLLERGVKVVINYVITKANIGEIAAFPAFVAKTFDVPGNRPGMRYSVAHVINQRVDPESVPRFHEISGPLQAALESALALNVDLKEVGGQCGVPPCVLRGDERFFPLDHSVSHSDTVDSNFQKLSVCEQCVYNKTCVGVRRGYVSLFGEDEFTPVTELPGLASAK